MMKRFTMLLTLCLLLTALAPRGFAAETDEPVRSCGDSLTWSLEGNTLTISGSGAMDDFGGGAPWDGSAEQIHTVILTGGVTTVGAGAFLGYENLTAVDFGDSLKEIGESAFQDCKGLTKISLPAVFRRFGASSFEGCTNLTEVYCAGGMPSFNSNCLWNGSNITIYCPVNNVWPSEYVEELENNFHGRLQVLTASGSDPYNFSHETQAPSQPAETTAPPTTVPVTQPTAVPATQPPTVPETTEATLPLQTLPAPTEAPVRDQESGSSSPVMGILVGVLIVSGTLSLLLIGLLIYRKKRDEDYDD